MNSPFAYFGGKRLAAPLVWQILGNCPRYIEPFCGSAAVLLARPESDGDSKRIEIINDLDGLIINTWRSLMYAPDKVAWLCSMPVTQYDLEARFRVLKMQREGTALRRKLSADPKFYDVELAGYFIYCMNGCIGTGWDKNKQLPRMSTVSSFMAMSDKEIAASFRAIRDRLRHVIIFCGDWLDVLRGSWLHSEGNCGIFLDPPYSGEIQRKKGRKYYAMDELNISTAVREWCAANGSCKDFKIVLCGYDDEHDSLLELGWRKQSWTANIGYSLGMHKRQEYLWCSPHCEDRQLTFF